MGKNVPPSRLSTTAATVCHMFASSAFLAKVVIRAMIPIASRQ
jgi:hypothetical protein